jgi:hypothetical protein
MTLKSEEPIGFSYVKLKIVKVVTFLEAISKNESIGGP